MYINKLIILISILVMNSIKGVAQVSKDVKPYKVGICLSGGAARGFAHIGVLRAFEEEGIEFDCVSGSSMGALIGLFYAAGKTPDEMLEISQTIKKSKLTTIGPFHFGKAGLDYVENLLKIHIKENTFNELKRRLFVCVTNFQTGKYEIIDTGDIMPAIRASVAIPIKYGNQMINGVPYIDGGVVNNLPVEPVKANSNIAIGISVNPIIEKEGKMNLRYSIMRLTELMLNENEARRIEMCDYHLEIQGLGNIGFEDYEKVIEIHNLGYNAAKKFLERNPELKERLRTTYY